MFGRGPISSTPFAGDAQGGGAFQPVLRIRARDESGAKVVVQDASEGRP